MNSKENMNMVNIRTNIDGHEVTLGYYSASIEDGIKKHEEIMGTKVISAEVKEYEGAE